MRGASSNGRLATGSVDQVLKTDGTDPSWGKIVNANITDATIEFAKLTTDAVALIPGVLLGILEDQKAANTDPQNGPGASWAARHLNTEVYDRLGILSVASNQITISTAGTYEIEWESPFFGSSAKTRLYNISDSAEVTVGTQGKWPGGTGNTMYYSTGIARVTIAGSKVFEVQMYGSANGGVSVNLDGKNEIYTRVIIRRG